MSLSAFRVTAIRRMMVASADSTTAKAATRQTTSKMTASERDAVLRDANEKMRQYHINRPPIELLKRKKHELRSKNAHQQRIEHGMQISLVVGFLFMFVATPFIGRKVAYDKEFREKYIPSWYDYSIRKPESAWTRKELHEQLIQVQSDLHERAIRGEFTPEKLDQMRRHFAGVNPEDDKHGWGKLHPGVDDDEDIEDD